MGTAGGGAGALDQYIEGRVNERMKGGNQGRKEEESSLAQTHMPVQVSSFAFK